MLQVDGTPGRADGGIAGVAAVLRGPHGAILAWRHGCVPATSSNAAEYQAIIFGLQLALEQYGQATVQCLSDSRIAVDQLSGRAAVHAASLIPLHAQARALVARLAHVTFSHIPREVNRLADALAWEALEGQRFFAAC